jgi:OmpA-OmpF porin, OOP family
MKTAAMINRIAGFSIASLLLAVPALAQEQTDPLKQSPNQTKTEADATTTGDKADVLATLKEETDIIRSLAPFADGNPNAPPREVRDVDSDDGKVRVDYSRAIDITVFFAYDSARLTPEARIQLAPLGKALQSKELLPYRFLIAGHTDAAGDAGYNRRLSLARAGAVREWLSGEYGIDPNRLVTHGWGESRLKDEGEPRASVNRRVEVALIMPGQSSSALEIDDIVDPCCSEQKLAFDVSPGRQLLMRDGVPHIADVPFVAHGRFVRPHLAQVRGCGRGRLYDPRVRLGAFALDDFGAAPTAQCARSLPLRQARNAEAADLDIENIILDDLSGEPFAK